MNTNMTGLDGYQKYLRSCAFDSCAFDKSSLSIGRVNGRLLASC